MSIQKISNFHTETITAIFIVLLVALLTVVMLNFGFSLPLFLVAMGVGFGLSFFYPRSGLSAIVFLTFIFERFFTLQSMFIGRSEYKLYPLDILLVAVIAGVAWQIFSKKISWKMNRADYALASFIGITLIYFLVSVLIGKADFSLAFSTFKNYAFYSLLYFAIFALIDTPERMTRFFHFAFAGAIAIFYFIIFGVVNGYGLWSEYTPLSTDGVRLLAFTHGFYLSLALLGLLAYWLYANNRQRALYYILLGAWAFGIVGSMMRHLWIALAIAIALIFVLITREQRRALLQLAGRFALAGVVAIVLTIYLASLFPNSTFSSMAYSVQGVISQRVGSLVGESATNDESFSWRLVVWKEAFKAYAESPVVGIGFGKLIYVESGKYRDMVEVRNIHNSPFILFVQMGFLGVIALGVTMLHNTAAVYRKKEKSWIDVFLLAALGFYALAFLFQPYLEANLLGIFFWIILGLIRVESVSIAKS